MDELFDAEGNLDTVKCKQLIPYGIGHFYFGETGHFYFGLT
jgi:hypothetical protein